MSKNDDGWEDKFFDKLIDQGFGLAKTLFATPAGLGLVSIGIGSYLKTLTKPLPETSEEKLRLRSEFRGENFIKNYVEPSGLSEDEFCRRFPKTKVGAPTCEVYNELTGKRVSSSRFDPVIDVFPFEIPGLIRADLGEIHLSDLMLIAGVLAIGGQAVEKIVEKVL